MTVPVVQRGALSIDVLVWIEARNRATGAPERLGLWTGLDAREFVVDGEARTYAGAGAVLAVEDIITQAGVAVQMQRAGLAILTPEVETLLRGYDARLAPVEIHRARFDPVTHELVDVTRAFRGHVDEMTESLGPKAGTSALSVVLASSARALTRLVPLRKSDATLASYGEDRFFRYAEVSGAAPIWWGQKPAKRDGSSGGVSGIFER